MKQLLQSLDDGRTYIEEVPVPMNASGHILIQSKVSLISAGTEKMLVDFGRAGLLKKALLQPDKVKQVVNKIKTDGLLPTVSAVRSKMQQPIVMGYCNVGVVVESSVTNFKIGDRVVSNGPHAEYVRVPKNLCAKIPDNVTDNEASFTVIASIGLHGVRIAGPTLGEKFIVVGLGLVGLLTAQILRANGCDVLGIDLSNDRCALAEKLGIKAFCQSDLASAEGAVKSFTSGIGADGVIITASTKSMDPITMAARACRKRGRVVLVGVVGLELDRSVFYEKELNFTVSCSYGPGRYDSDYEIMGNDYPLPYVRWTEGRNFSAILGLMGSGRIQVNELIEGVYPFEDAAEVYSRIGSGFAPGLLLGYGASLSDSKGHVVRLYDHPKIGTSNVVVGFLGAGNYASRVLIPNFKKLNVSLRVLVSLSGVNATVFGKKYGFQSCATTGAAVFNDEQVNLVVISTRHDAHAEQVVCALRSNKHVFVEKPLCISWQQLDAIKELYENEEVGSLLTVGYNRRCSPLVSRMKNLLRAVSVPLKVIITVNAGELPSGHWLADENIGGGRLVGEGCHFIDLLIYIVGSTPMGCDVSSTGRDLDDSFTLTFSFEDGSLGTLHYLSNCGDSYSKERVEVFADGATLCIDNFKSMHGYSWNGFRKMKLSSQDKGHRVLLQRFIDALVEGGAPPIPLRDILLTQEWVLRANDLLKAH